MVQSLTLNPKSLNANGLRTLRTTKKVLLDFLMPELVGVVPPPCTLLQKLKARMMIPYLGCFPENIGLLENLRILRPKINAPWNKFANKLKQTNTLSEN